MHADSWSYLTPYSQIILYKVIGSTSSRVSAAAPQFTSPSQLYSLFGYLQCLCLLLRLSLPVRLGAFLPKVANFQTGLALRHFVLRRLSFASHLDASSSALTTSRYLRLMTMAALQMVWSITVSSYALWFTTLSVPLQPWTTWADVHSDWGHIDTFIAILTPPIVDRAYYVLWWLVPTSTFGFVAFFSFGKDAMDEYEKFFAWIRIKICRHSFSAKSSKADSQLFLSQSVVPFF